jgi:hypothetical protein
LFFIVVMVFTSGAISTDLVLLPVECVEQLRLRCFTFVISRSQTSWCFLVFHCFHCFRASYFFTFSLFFMLFMLFVYVASPLSFRDAKLHCVLVFFIVFHGFHCFRASCSFTFLLFCIVFHCGDVVWFSLVFHCFS